MIDPAQTGMHPPAEAQEGSTGSLKGDTVLIAYDGGDQAKAAIEYAGRSCPRITPTSHRGAHPPQAAVPRE